MKEQLGSRYESSIASGWLSKVCGGMEGDWFMRWFMYILRSLDENNLAIPEEQPSERGLIMRAWDLSWEERWAQSGGRGDRVSSWKVIEILGREEIE